MISRCVVNGIKLQISRVNLNCSVLYTNMFYHIINTCEVRLWGVRQQERIRKVLARIGEFNECSDLKQLPENENILLLKADYLYEANVIKKLITQSNKILVSSCVNKTPAAAWIEAPLATEIITMLEGGDFTELSSHLDIVSPLQLTGGYDPRLRKYDLAHVVKVSTQDQRVIENYLYDKSYKGITDLVTKWWWPLPARWFVRKCASMNITPNMVTGFGWLLTIFCGFAFYYGEFIIGLAAAWVMTFLDTVDGKLARVTLQSSKIGHVMDHGLDIIHPPIWYWCWVVGLGISHITFLGIDLPVMSWIWILLTAYIGGRIFEGLFQLLFNDISIFCWKPIDSFHRLVTARRNPCMIMLTLSLILADPELGFMWVVAWSVLSTLFLALRFLYACLVRVISGPLISWVENIEPSVEQSNLAVRLFTGYPALKTIAPLLNKSC